MNIQIEAKFTRSGNVGNTENLDVKISCEGSEVDYALEKMDKLEQHFKLGVLPFGVGAVIKLGEETPAEVTGAPQG